MNDFFRFASISAVVLGVVYTVTHISEEALAALGLFAFLIAMVFTVSR